MDEKLSFQFEDGKPQREEEKRVEEREEEAEE
jgi:hypothetical protein